jgi:hypothetical protein
MLQNSIIVFPITCPKGHIFYPRISHNGIVKKYTNCPFRNCRMILDRKKVQNGIKKRNKYLIPGVKKDRIGRVHPVCTICRITLYDVKELTKHNKRLHDS